MDSKKTDSKISKFISSVTKKGSKYSRLAKQEFNLMVLLEKKNGKFLDLGKLVYALSGKKDKKIDADRNFEQVIADEKEVTER